MLLEPQHKVREDSLPLNRDPNIPLLPSQEKAQNTWPAIYFPASKLDAVTQAGDKGLLFSRQLP